MTNNDRISELIEEVKSLKINITELKSEIQQLKSVSRSKTPGVFQPGDKYVVSTNGIVGKAGDRATVKLAKGGNSRNRRKQNVGD